MKRIRSLLLILLALLLVMQLGACGSTAPAGETEQPQQETEETDEATPESAEETARTLVEQGWALAYPDSGEPDYAAARRRRSWAMRMRSTNWASCITTAKASHRTM